MPVRYVLSQSGGRKLPARRHSLPPETLPAFGLPVDRIIRCDLGLRVSLLCYLPAPLLRTQHGVVHAFTRAWREIANVFLVAYFLLLVQPGCRCAESVGLRPFEKAIRAFPCQSVPFGSPKQLGGSCLSPGLYTWPCPPAASW